MDKFILLVGCCLFAASLPDCTTTQIVVSDKQQVVVYGNITLPLAGGETLDKLVSLIDKNRTKLAERVEPRLRRALGQSPETDSEHLVGPSCVPLVSADIRFNPYHWTLLSKPGAEVRRGLGSPVRISGVASIDCTGRKHSCGLEIERGSTATATDTLTVSSSHGSSESFSLGNTRSSSHSNAISRSIARGSEQSLTNTEAVSNERSLSKSLSDSLTNTLANSVSDSKSRGSEQRHGTTNEKSSSEEKNRKGNVGGSISIPFLPISVNGGGEWGSGETRGERNSFEDSNSETNSASSEVGRQDTVARAVEAARSESESNGRTNTHSDTNSKSYTVNDGTTETSEMGQSQTSQHEKGTSSQDEKSVQNTRTRTSTMNAKLSVTVEPGTCRVPVCKPIVLSKIVPYQCLDSGLLTNATAEMSLVLGEGKREFGCTVALVPCNDGLGGDQPPFRLTDDEFHNADHSNSLEFGRHLRAGQSFSSASGQFKLMLAQTGELRLTKQDTLVWSSDVRSFAAYETRARLTDNGQLVVEVNALRQASEEYANSKCLAGSIFSEADKFYKCTEDDWTVIWSSAPIQHAAVQIGLATRPGQQVAYRLVLSDAGELRLFDSYGVKIWCTHSDCAHGRGYKYPRRYGMPTNMITEPVAGDVHNTLPRSLRQLGDRLESVDQQCRRLAENEALVSPNGRFTAYLSAKGSFVLKDKHRTMWDSMSSNLAFAEPPYNLVVTRDGQLLIRDSKHSLVWTTVDNSTDGQRDWKLRAKPIRLQLTDRGALEVVDATDSIVWTSWITSRQNAARVWRKPVNVCFSECDNCQLATTTTTTPAPITQPSYEDESFGEPLNIVHKASGKCVGHSKGRVILWDCVGVQDQGWQLGSKSGRLRNTLLTDKCLIRSGLEDVVLGDCSSRWARWLENDQQLKSQSDQSKCLDLWNNHPANNNPIAVIGCRPRNDAYRSAQEWVMRRADLRELRSDGRNLLFENQRLFSDEDQPVHAHLDTNGYVILPNGARLDRAHDFSASSSPWVLELRGNGILVIRHADSQETVWQSHESMSPLLRAPFTLTLCKCNRRLRLRDANNFEYWRVGF